MNFIVISLFLPKHSALLIIGCNGHHILFSETLLKVNTHKLGTGGH